MATASAPERTFREELGVSGSKRGGSSAEAVRGGLLRNGHPGTHIWLQMLGSVESRECLEASNAFPRTASSAALSERAQVGAAGPKGPHRPHCCHEHPHLAAFSRFTEYLDASNACPHPPPPHRPHRCHEHLHLAGASRGFQCVPTHRPHCCHEHQHLAAFSIGL